MDEQIEIGNTKFESSDGRLLVELARASITSFLNNRKMTIPSRVSKDSRFEQKLGCFVTLKEDKVEKSLRGCIGFTDPEHSLSRALTEAAILAAIEDPRFPPVKKSELDSLLLEVSLLSKPVQIHVSDQRELLTKIKVGPDGLIMKWSFGSGLLLPQVASECSWNVEEFLANLSLKAGGLPDQWLDPGTLIYKFGAQVFQELSPNGNVILT